MKNLILLDLDKGNLSNIKKITIYKELISFFKNEINDIVIILNKPYLQCEEILKNNNIDYDYLISNNTLFSKEGNVLWVNYLKSFNIELFLCEISKSSIANNVKFFNEYGFTDNISNLVKISIKNGIFNNSEYLVDKLSKKDLVISKSNGCINISPNNAFLNCIEFLSNNENYQKIFLLSKNKFYNECIRKYNKDSQSIKSKNKIRILKNNININQMRKR